MPATMAFSLQVSIVMFFLAGSSAPTPLYAVYQSEWGFSPITTTIVFGVYALAVLAALLTAGRLSDHIGRRPVLFGALVAQAATMLVFTTAGGVGQLMVARVVQGLSTGAALGALGAGLLDLHRSRGTVANAVGPLTGVALGGVGSGLLVQYLPVPTHLVYLVLFGVFVVQAVGVTLMAETASPRPGALASLRPSFGLPAAVRGPALIAVPALVAGWSLVGLYGSLSPALVRRLLGVQSYVLGGLALSTLAVSGALSVLLLRNLPARRMMALGTSVLLAGVAGLVTAVGTGSTVLFFAATSIAGAGMGAAFQGAIRTVVPLARPEERAGVLSLLYTVSYLAMGLPAVIAGFLVVHGGGLTRTAVEYGAAVMLLAGSALAGLIRAGRRPAPVPAPPSAPRRELVQAR